mgnify:CR=1 FL=1
MRLRPPEIVEFERLQKTLEETRNIAIIRPTEANVRRYMELEATVVRQPSYCSEVAQRVAWPTADLDMTLQGRPVNARGIERDDAQAAHLFAAAAEQGIVQAQNILTAMGTPRGNT